MFILLFINYTSIWKKKRPKRHRSVLGDFTENHHLWHSHLATVHWVPTLCLPLCWLIKKLPHGQLGWPLSVPTVLLCLRHKDSESCPKTSFNFRSVSLHATASKGIIYCVVSYCVSACPYMRTRKRIHQERTRKHHSKLHSQGVSTRPAEERKNAACSHADDLSSMLQFLLLPFVWVGEHIICRVPQSLVCHRLLFLTFLLKTTLLRPVIIISKLPSPEFTWWEFHSYHMKSSEKAQVNLICNGSLV